MLIKKVIKGPKRLYKVVGISDCWYNTPKYDVKVKVAGVDFKSLYERFLRCVVAVEC